MGVYRFSVWQLAGLGVGSGRELRGLGEGNDLRPCPVPQDTQKQFIKIGGQTVEEKGVIRIKN